MNYKKIMKSGLLVFIVASLGYLVYTELGAEKKAASADPQTVPAPTEQARVMAYYFHGTNRCVTCRTIEQYSRQAIESGFAEELQAGTIKFLAVNVDEPENRHFIQDYQLVTKSLILAEMDHGRQKRWKNLDQVWTLVRTQPLFIGYVQAEVREYLKGQP